MRKLVVVFVLAILGFVGCKKEYNTSSTISAGTLSSASDNCTGAVINGTYKSNTAVTGANTVTLTVNVIKPGTYTILSDTLKGLSFKGKGSFTATGVQSVTILGSGTPIDSAAALRFRVQYGTSSCTFVVKIDNIPVVVVPSTGDFFPSTSSSNWSYDNYSQTGIFLDSVYVSSTGLFKAIQGIPYDIFLQNHGTYTDSFFHKKNAGIYYNTSQGTSVISNSSAQATRILKDNVPAGSTWADTFNVIVSGQDVLLKYDYTILSKAVPATINTFSWLDVIKTRAVISTNFTGSFVLFQTLETWFAKGTGVIYQKTTYHSTTPNTFRETRLRRFTVVP